MRSPVTTDPEPELVALLLAHFGRDGVSVDRSSVAGLRLVEDLGFDSIELFELLVILEEALGRPLDEDFMSGVQTVRDACYFLNESHDPVAAFEAAGL